MSIYKSDSKWFYKSDSKWFMAHQAFMKVCPKRSKILQIFHCIIFPRKPPIFLLQKKVGMAKISIYKSHSKWFMAHQAFMKVFPRCSLMFQIFHCIIFPRKNPIFLLWQMLKIEKKILVLKRTVHGSSSLCKSLPKVLENVQNIEWHHFSQEVIFSTQAKVEMVKSKKKKNGSRLIKLSYRFAQGSKYSFHQFSVASSK